MLESRNRTKKEIHGKSKCQAQQPRGNELVIQCLHWCRGSIPTPCVYSAAISLGTKGLTVHNLVFLDGTSNRRPCVCTHITLLTHKISSSKTSKPLWPVIIDDNAPTLKRRKLDKTYKNRKLIGVAGVCWETYSKNDKRIVSNPFRATFLDVTHF